MHSSVLWCCVVRFGRFVCSVPSSVLRCWVVLSLCELFNGRCRGPGPGAPGPVACGTGFGVWAGGPGPGSGARASGSGPGPRARGSGPGDGGPGPGPGPGAWGPGPGACPLHVQFPPKNLLTPRAREKFCQHSTRNQVYERTGAVDIRRTYCLPGNECQKMYGVVMD